MRQVAVAVLFLVAGCVGQAPEGAVTVKELAVTSPAFQNNGTIPSKYTCQGEDINPPLEINGIPEATVSLVLIVEDPDASPGTWVHWVVFDIKPQTGIWENSIPGTEGINDFREHAYGGPCPPSGTHHYYFIVYALDSNLSLSSDARKKEVERAMEGHILARGVLVGLFSKGQPHSFV